MAATVVPDLERRLGLYRVMVECRRFEARAQELFFEGLVRGTTHLGVGQEAVAAGVAAAMREDDYTFCTYRGHNHTLARGVPMAPIFAELFTVIVHALTEALAQTALPIATLPVIVDTLTDLLSVTSTEPT